MASPIAHGLVAAILYSIYKGPKNKIILAIFICVACLPDFDFIGGLLWGDLGKFHRGLSHSLSFLLTLSFVISFLGVRKELKLGVQLFLWGTLLLWSHCLVDYLTFDWSEPHGIMLFWPWSNKYYMSFWTPLKGIYWGESVEDYLNKANILSILREIIVLVPVYLWVRFGFRHKVT